MNNNIQNLPTDAEQLRELIELCAVDDELFCRTFFPKTVRQKSPPFHKEIWQLLNSNQRLVNAQVFRGGGKTSILRMYTAKRIAFGLAHTILYIGKSEGHAIRSIKWLRTQIEHNYKFASVFHLKPGKKWQDTEAEIWHGTDEYPVWILGMGITGSVRGINLDDYRPDLIIVDDVIDDENSATVDQRTKIEDLILGALKESLAPATEAEDAKLVMLQTPLNKEDASCKAATDSEWISKVFGCWTKATETLSLNQQESAWPTRWPNAVLRAEKQAAIKRNKLSLWNREKECKLTSVETCTFKEQWLRFYDVEPEFMKKVIAIDPVPPPSDIQIAKGLKNKDYEAFACVGRHKGDFYLLEYEFKRGHDPEWTIMQFFRMCIKWKPMLVIVETVAYQKTLSWLIKKAMDFRQRYFVIKEYTDHRSKYDRISDGLSGIASSGHLFVRKDQVDFISQFRDYPDISHDDIIEVVAIAVAELSAINYMSEAEDDAYGIGTFADEQEIPQLEYIGGAP